MNPRHGPRHVNDLLTPGHGRLQSVIDDCDSYAPSRVKATDVAVWIGASEPQPLVAAPPSAAVNENQDRPTLAFGPEKIQAIAAHRLLVIPVAQVLVHLYLRYHGFPVKDLYRDPFGKITAARNR